MKGRGDVDDALARTGAARGQRCALPTVAAFAHIPTARYGHDKSKETGTGESWSEAARVGQIYFGDLAGKWVRFESALTSMAVQAMSMNLKSLLNKAMGDLIAAHGLSLIELSETEVLMVAPTFTIDVCADRDGVSMVYFDTRSKPAKGYNILLFLLNKRRDRLSFAASEVETSNYDEFIEQQLNALVQHLRSAGSDILAGHDDWMQTYSWPPVRAQGSAAAFI